MAWPLRLVRDTVAVADDVRAQAATADDYPAAATRDATSDLIAAIAEQAVVRVTRRVAIQVPPFARALGLYTGLISTFPLREYVDGDQIVARPFLRQPCRDRTTGWLIARTIDDLLCYSRAWWRIDARGWDGYPSTVTRIPAADVTVDGNDDPWWQGKRLRDVIRFDSPYDAWLEAAANIVTTAAALEAAVQRYAESPMPQIALKNTGSDLPAAQVDALLDAWETARAARSTAYLNSVLDTVTFGWSARDVQLVEAREAAAVQIARMANLDPVWLGANISGSTVTYANRVDLYRQLVDMSLAPVMRAVSDRLAMGDVTPRGHAVRFDTTTFLRDNPDRAAQLITQLLPLDVVTVDEARRLIDLPTGDQA